MRLRRLSFAPLLLLSFLCLAQVSCARDVDRRDSRPIAPGVELLTHRQVAGPWEVRAVKIQRGAEAVRLQGAVAHRRLPGVDTLSHIIEQYADAQDATVAAVNADFFVMAGNPRAGNVIGLTIIDGELLTTARGRPAFVLMADGTPRIGVFETTAGLAVAGKTLAIAGINCAVPQDGACLFTSAWSPWEEPGVGVVLTVPGLPLGANGRWEATVARKLVAGRGALGRRAGGSCRGRGRRGPGRAADRRPGSPRGANRGPRGTRQPRRRRRAGAGAAGQGPPRPRRHRPPASPDDGGLQ